MIQSNTSAITDDRTGFIMEAQRELQHGTPAEWQTKLEQRGVTPADATLIIAEAQEFNASAADAQTTSTPPGEPRNDLGNGNRLAKRHGHELRYIVESKSWLAWDGRLWVPGAIGAVERHAKDAAEGIYDEAKRMRRIDKAEADNLAKWASASCNRSKTEAMIYMARSHERIEAGWEDFDANPLALNVANGTVDLTSGKLRRHDPAEMHSKIAGASLTGDRAPSWESFLVEVLPDPEVRHYVHKLAGYSITGEVGEHVLPFAYGGGANGKSVFLSVIRKVLGSYAAEAAPDLLVARYERGIPVDIIDLRGFRFVTTSEIEGGRKMATDVMKRITGDDELKARKMRQNFESFRNVTHLWMAANDRPQVDGLDEAIWRRIRMLPFTVTIPAAQRDPRLIEKLLRERHGILGWLVEGSLLYQAEGLLPPAGVEAATAEYRNDSNPLLAWCEACCTLEAGETTSSEALHGSYQAWCAESRYRGKPLPSKSPKWGAALAGLGFKRTREKDFRGWEGLRLNDVAAGMAM